MRCAGPSRSLGNDKELYVSKVKRGGKSGFRSPPGGGIRQAWKNSTLAALAVGEIQRADGGNPYEHENGGEQDDYNQGSLLVLPKEEQLYRQALRAFLSMSFDSERSHKK